jgi:hypothetical protein
MADLLITKTSPGVAKVTSTDPFSNLELHRVDRTSWQATPETPGVYLLYGLVDENPAAYVGMSTTSMRQRIRNHHVAPKKNWFGVIFAIPLAPMLCQVLEAELIRRVREADVVAVINEADEARWLDADDVHVAPALETIVGALEMLLGNDIFNPQETEDGAVGVDALQKPVKLARTYKGAASQPRPRQMSDPAAATHAYVGAGVPAWGRFEADEPDPRFRVLATSTWRRPNLDLSQASYAHQARVASRQEPLIASGVLDSEAMTFTADHVFENWSQAVAVVSGKGSYSGGYHWQRIQDDPTS